MPNLLLVLGISGINSGRASGTYIVSVRLSSGLLVGGRVCQ